ncbi:probable serine/threonine-protein kinase DDB_G0282963 [Toxorhynchites rutilus septentrionalis]|uniref:probable serine/threonine-protein kinase DDB_G0282963 n=1 Tax=Toxorhynchites rutilus septentrionalis TaxID=329112 RepID=UPI0024794DAE|nr:probable serine/threonine-protein kinase DDB_G0282963 [Toxorhynchites rutilus septentrionalis]
MLLTLWLSSASPLAVPSVAQSQNHRKQHDISSGAEKIPIAPTPTISHHQQQQQQVQHHDQRKIDAISSIDLIRYWPETPPDLYNITLSAMKQYIRSQLNSTGKGFRKRSHHHPNAEVDFYKQFKAFNNTQSAFSSNTIGYSKNKSSTANVSESTRPWFNESNVTNYRKIIPEEPDGSRNSIQVDDPMASFVHPLGNPAVGNDQLSGCGETTGSVDTHPPVSGGTPLQNKDYSVLMDDPRGYIVASSSYPQRPMKTTRWDSTFVRHRGYVYFLLSFSLIGAVVVGLFGVYRCIRVTASRTPTEALALPIQFITDDLAASLNAESNHPPVPMLSVQSPGCAGMERLGVPARSSIGSPPLRDERNRRLRVDSGVPNANSNSPAIYQNHLNVHHHSHHGRHHHDHLIVSSSTSSNFMTNHNHHSQFHQPTSSLRHQTSATTFTTGTSQKGSSLTDATGGSGSSSGNTYGKANHSLYHQNCSSSYGVNSIANNNSSLCSTSISRCPHHVALPDGERGPDRDLQIRSSCQQSEIPRTYVKAPPNKTVRDVPAQYQSGASSTSSSMSNLNSHLRSSVANTGGSSNNSSSSHPVGGGVSLGNRAIVNSLSTLGSGNGSGSATAGSSSNQPKSEKLKQILRFLPGNKTSKSSTSGINVSSSSNNNNNNGSNSNSTSCNNNNYQPRSNPNGNGIVVGASGSGRSGLSSSGGSNLAVSGIHNHNHHYRQSAASVQQRQQHPTGLSSSVPNASSGSSLGSSTPTSLSVSPSPDTSTHYM